jgi:hypothetical protein
VGTCWDCLYSRNRGVNKRREITAGMYPVEALSQKRELPKRFKKSPKKVKEFESPWNDEKRKQREFLSAKKKQLQEIGENANGKAKRRKPGDERSQNALSQSHSAANLLL